MDYLVPCQYSIRLIEKLKSLDTKKVLDLDLIDKAIYWAKKYHGDQKRKSGEPYYSHPLEVAYMISEYKLKTDVIVASILHDIIEDTEVTAGMIIDNFSWRITEMVDKEVLFIKLIDRLHNIQTIAFQSPEKRKKTVEQTFKKFTSLVMYYGVRQIELDLDRLCRQYLAVRHVNQNATEYYKIFSENNSQILALAYKND
jgi:(p)ppGpp synthase/HD superfamily hydrolase